jgi:hypothetical protein
VFRNAWAGVTQAGRPAGSERDQSRSGFLARVAWCCSYDRCPDAVAEEIAKRVCKRLETKQIGSEGEKNFEWTATIAAKWDKRIFPQIRLDFQKHTDKDPCRTDEAFVPLGGLPDAVEPIREQLAIFRSNNLALASLGTC